jgi:tetratricopeptide (TPR) repeat protein
MSRRTSTILLFVLLIFGALVRLWFFQDLKDHPLATIPLLDCGTYHEWAADLVAGDWGRNHSYWMGPLFPHLLALVYKLFGVGSAVALLLQLALSLVNVYLVYLLGRRLTGSEGIAILATALYSVYGAPVFYAGQLLIATVGTTMYLWAGLRLITAAEKPSPGNVLKLGLVVGLAGLARGNMLLLLLPAAWLVWRACDGGPARRAGLVALLWSTALLMLLPVTARNLIMADDFVLLTSNGGVNLYIGQNAEYKGIFAPVIDEPEAEFDPSMESTLERELGRDLKGSEVSRILMGRAWRLFRDNLAEMPLHYLRKIYRFWNGYELPQIVSYDYWRTQFPAFKPLFLPYTILSALGLAGLLALPRDQRWVMLALVGAYFLSLLPFFPTSRYRMPLAPLLAVCAAAYLVILWQASGGKRWRGLAGGVLLVAALWPNWASLDQTEVLWQVHLHEASRASKLGQNRATLVKGRLAEEVRPGLADTPFHLSLYLEDMGDRENALAALQLARTRAPRNRLIPYKIGRNHEEMGQLEEAVAAFKESAALSPDWAYPWLRLGLVYRQMGDAQQSLAAFTRARELGPGHHRVRANLASAYAEAGQLDQALLILQDLTRDFPHYVNGWFNLALVQLQLGRTEAAARALDRAAALQGLTDSQQAQINQLRQVLQQRRSSPGGR